MKKGGYHKAILGDCLGIMRKMPPNSVDLVFTDPPYNQDIKYLVKKAGFIDARTTIVFSYDTPVDYYQTDTTLHMYNGRPEYKGKNWYDFVDEYLQAALDRYGEFHVWGHAFELDRDDQWEQFEKMLDKVQKYIVKGYELI